MKEAKKSCSSYVSKLFQPKTSPPNIAQPAQRRPQLIHEGPRPTLPPEQSLANDSSITNRVQRNDSSREGEQESEVQSTLRSVINSFNQNYEQFAVTHSLVLTSDTDMLAALQMVETERDVRFAAQIFRKEIRRVLEKAVEKHDRSNKNWTGLVANFLAKLYPFVKLSLRLTSAIAEVLNKINEDG